LPGSGSNANARVPVLKTGEEIPAAPRQERSIQKRRKLLEAGRLLFAEKGYEATSIEEITSRAGTASGGFYQYFSSKRQFLIVLMNELIQRLSSLDLRPAAGGTDVRTGLRKFLAAVFRVDVAYFGVIRAWQEAALADAELDRMQQEIESWTQTRILGVFQRLRKHPDARPDADLVAFARMMDRHFWGLLARGSRMSARAFQREITVAADVIYYYLFGGAPRKED